MKSLTTLELDELLKNNTVTKKYFLGTFPACMSPLTTRKKYSFLTNTDEHNKGGIHWCAWMVDGDEITFFDSFGRHPKDPAFPRHFSEIMKNFKLRYSNIQLQDFRSNACGYYCIHFLYILSLGLDLDYMFYDYSSDFKKNDTVVYNLVCNL